MDFECLASELMFQSSPNPKVGCRSALCTRLCFNPDKNAMYKFQSSPNPKVGCHLKQKPTSLFQLGASEQT